MKITIDTTEKIVELTNEVNLKELVDTLKFLNLDWKEFKIVSANKCTCISYLPYQPFLNPPYIITTSI